MLILKSGNSFNDKQAINKYDFENAANKQSSRRSSLKTKLRDVCSLGEKYRDSNGFQEETLKGDSIKLSFL